MSAPTVAFSGARLLERADVARLEPFGLGEYGDVLRLQEALRGDRQADRIPDTWLVGEHPIVITQGVRGGEADLAPLARSARPIPVFQVDRGGMTTLHSPGQLILYPIVKVRGGSLAAGRLARALLDAVGLWLLDSFGVRATTPARRPGLFVEDRKLASIGLSVRGGVSMHGVAINLCNDLSLWRTIIACGDASILPVTLSEILGRRVEPAEQLESLARWLAEVWGYGRVAVGGQEDAR